MDLLVKENVDFIVTKDIGTEETRSFLTDLSDAFYLSIGAAWIFGAEVIGTVFEGRLFNLHGTRLPQNRGGGGFSWQIMMGNRLGFCQMHLVDSGVDTGDIVRTREFLYPPQCRKPADYQQHYLKENLVFVTDFFREIRREGVSLDTTRQSEYFSTYWPRLSTEINAWIDWNESVDSIERFICAFDDPYEGAKTLLNGEKVFIKEVCADYSDPQFHAFQSGIVFRKSSDWISVCTNGGTLIVQSITDEGKNSLLEGIKVGDRLFTPHSMLSERANRVAYTPSGLKRR